MDIISTYNNLGWVHASINSFEGGYFFESKFEVDYAHKVENDTDDEKYDIMVVNGISFMLGQA